MSPVEKAHRLLAPRIAYLIGTQSPDRTPNMIPVSNVTSISTDPQQIATAIYKQWQTHHYLLAADGFTLSVPHVGHLSGVWKLGAKYSHYPYVTNTEKIIDSGLAIDYTASEYGPVLSNAIGWITCRTLRILDFEGDHTLFIAQAEETYFNPEYLTPDGTPRSGTSPLMQITGNTFTTTGNTQTIPYCN